jgi:hypothetical protein
MPRISVDTRPHLRGPARNALVAGAAAVCLALVGVACGDDKPSGSSATSATTAPEEKQSRDAEVSAGLKALPALVDAAVAAASSGNGTAAFEPIEASWRTYEGTVRAKESDIYLAIEDEFANLQKAIDEKDAAKAEAAKTKIVAAANQYLAKHP